MDTTIQARSTSPNAPPPFPCFFAFDGEAWTPEGPSRSPWNPAAINGMSLAGLLMHLAAQVEAPGPMLPAHVTVDILRPVPFAPTLTRTAITREGKKMQMVESYLLAAGEVVARARVLRVREAPSPRVVVDMPYPSPEDVGLTPFFPPTQALGRLIETRLIAGGTVGAPRGAIWARFNSELAPGIPIVGLVQAAMLSDFGNGLSRITDAREWSFANLDISMHLVRRPVGEWMLVEADGLLDGLGVGLSNMMLADQLGQLGRAHQTLFIAPTD